MLTRHATPSRFHTIMSHSAPVYLAGMKADFQGILLLMWGSTIPLIYYGFPCRPQLQVAYWAGTTTLAALCSAVTLLPRFSVPRMGNVRAALFGSFGLSSFVAPVVHGVLVYGLAEQAGRIALPWVGLTVVCNGVGVTAYASKVSFGQSVLTFFRQTQSTYTHQPMQQGKDANVWACSFRKSGSPKPLISSARATRSCT
jgi:predicted membrane channel-forming protein YqfA (hemolysin III family)